MTRALEIKEYQWQCCRMPRTSTPEDLRVNMVQLVREGWVVWASNRFGSAIVVRNVAKEA